MNDTDLQGKMYCISCPSWRTAAHSNICVISLSYYVDYEILCQRETVHLSRLLVRNIMRVFRNGLIRCAQAFVLVALLRRFFFFFRNKGAESIV